MQFEKSTNSHENVDLYPQMSLPIQRGDITRIASTVGVDHSHVSRWINGKYKNQPEDHDALMDALLEIIEERQAKEKEHQDRIKRIRSLS